jgi:hypothetical protein
LLGVESMPEAADPAEVGDPVDDHLADGQHITFRCEAKIRGNP